MDDIEIQIKVLSVCYTLRDFDFKIFIFFHWNILIADKKKCEVQCELYTFLYNVSMLR